MKRWLFPILGYLGYTRFTMPSRLARTGRTNYPLKPWVV